MYRPDTVILFDALVFQWLIFKNRPGNSGREHDSIGQAVQIIAQYQIHPPSK
jgi:hypothetical protein